MVTITLKNSFHNTEIKVKFPFEIEPEEFWLIVQDRHFNKKSRAATRLYKKIFDTLCGIPDCKCGTVRM